MRRRSQVVATCAALAVAAGGGALYVGTQSDLDVRPNRSATSPTAADREVRPLPLGPLDDDRLAPTPAGVAAAVDRLVDAAGFGGGLAGVVVDAGTGDVLFSRRPRARLTPASTVKLLTAAAALHALGPDTRLTTRVAEEGRTLYLVGGGDMTLASRPPRSTDYPTAPSLTDLAAQVAVAVDDEPRTPFRLRYDDSAWSGPTSAAGWNDGYFYGGDVSRLSALAVDEGRLDPRRPTRVAETAAHAAATFAGALSRAGVRVRGDPLPAAPPDAATVVATVSSAPVGALVQRMLTVSDNDLAEALGRAIALRVGQPPTFTGAARAIRDQLPGLGVPVGGVRLYDGSGLSRLDRVTPSALVGLLRVVQARPELQPVLAGLPVAGLTGTVADRYRAGPTRSAAGLVRAKTGTLAGVSALAGQLVDADGRLLLFAFLTDRAPSPESAEDALDRLATRLTRCGCREAA